MAGTALKRSTPKRPAGKRGESRRTAQAKAEAKVRSEASKRGQTRSPGKTKLRQDLAKKAKLIKSSLRAGYSAADSFRKATPPTTPTRKRKATASPAPDKQGGGTPASGSAKRADVTRTASPTRRRKATASPAPDKQGGGTPASGSAKRANVTRTASPTRRRKATASPAPDKQGGGTPASGSAKRANVTRTASPTRKRKATASPAPDKQGGGTPASGSAKRANVTRTASPTRKRKATASPTSSAVTASSYTRMKLTNTNLAKFLKGPDTFFTFLRPALTTKVVKVELDTMKDRTRDLAREIKNNFDTKYSNAKTRPFYQRVSRAKYKPTTKTLRQRKTRSTEPASDEEAVPAEVVEDQNREGKSSEPDSEHSSSDEETIVVPSTDNVPARDSFHLANSLWNRLLVEDVMFLQPGAEVLLLVKISVTDDEPTCTNFLRLAQLSDQQPRDYPFVTFRKKDYFQVHGIVAKNIYRDKLLTGYWDQREVYDHVFGKHRGCVSVAFEGNKGQKKVNIYWGDVQNRHVVVMSSPPWGKSRDFYATFESSRRNPAAQLQLFNCLYDECVFDKFLSCNLLLAYNKCLKHTKNDECTQWKEVAMMYCDFEMAGPKFVACLQAIDDMFRTALIRCFRELCPVLQPIVSQRDVQHCVTLLKKECRGLVDVVWEMLGFHRLPSNHLMKTYERKVLYHILSMSRVRNSQYAVHWAMVRTAALYCVGASRQFFSQTSYFGVGTSSNTFLQFVRPLGERMEGRVFIIVNKHLTSWFIFDNNQKNFRLFYQRHGQANVFIKVTSRLVKEFIPWLLRGEIPTINEGSVDVTIFEQDIPSALGMPTFSRVTELKDWARVIKKHHYFCIGKNDKVDYSGRSVRKYMKGVSACEGLHALWHCMSLPRTYVAFEPESVQNECISCVGD